MTLRLQTFLTGMLAIIAAALLMFAPASANPTSGGYQLFGPVVHGVADDNPLIALEDFDHFAKVAPECCNAPNGGLPPNIKTLSELNITNTGETVLGHFRVTLARRTHEVQATSISEMHGTI